MPYVLYEPRRKNAIKKNKLRGAGDHLTPNIVHMHLCMCTCSCNWISSLLYFNTKKSHIGNQEICVLWMLDKFKGWYKNKVSDGHPKKYVNRLVRFKFVFNNCPYANMKGHLTIY